MSWKKTRRLTPNSWIHLATIPSYDRFIHSFTRYAVQTQVHVAVAVRLAQKVAVGENGEVAGGVDDGGNDVLLHEEDLISVHAEVVVFLEELESSEGEGEEMRGYRAWLESDVMIARGMRWDRLSGMRC